MPQDILYSFQSRYKALLKDGCNFVIYNKKDKYTRGYKKESAQVLVHDMLLDSYRVI